MLLSDLVRNTIENANIVTREVAAPKKKGGDRTPPFGVWYSDSDGKKLKMKPTMRIFNETKKALLAAFAAIKKEVPGIATPIPGIGKRISLYVGHGGPYLKITAYAKDKSKILAVLKKQSSVYKKQDATNTTEPSERKPAKKGTSGSSVRATAIVSAVKNGDTTRSLGITDKEALQILVKYISRTKAK